MTLQYKSSGDALIYNLCYPGANALACACRGCYVTDCASCDAEYTVTIDTDVTCLNGVWTVKKWTDSYGNNCRWKIDAFTCAGHPVYIELIWSCGYNPDLTIAGWGAFAVYGQNNLPDPGWDKLVFEKQRMDTCDITGSYTFKWSSNGGSGTLVVS